MFLFASKKFLFAKPTSNAWNFDACVSLSLSASVLLLLDPKAMRGTAIPTRSFCSFSLIEYVCMCV